MAGPGDRRAVHPAVPAVLGHRGQLADKYDKARADPLRQDARDRDHGARGGRASVRADVPLLLGCVFLMGLHSTLFGPVKYAYLPQHLSERELTGGNGMVEMGTFVAILLGNVAGGLLVALPRGRRARLRGGLRRAGAGRPACCAAHSAQPGDRSRPAHQLEPVHRDLAQPAARARQPVVFRSLLGISWMWFFGAVFLASSRVREGRAARRRACRLAAAGGVLGRHRHRLAAVRGAVRRQVEIGLVPLGAIGMSVFAIDLYFASRGLPPAAPHRLGAVRRAAGALARDGRPGAAVAVRRPLQRADVCADPDALPAHPPRPHHRGQQHPQRAVHDRQRADRRRAAGAPAVSIPQVFLSSALLNAVVALYIFLLVPEYLLRFVAFVLTRWSTASGCAGDAAHSRRRAGDAGVQPRELRRRRCC